MSTYYDEVEIEDFEYDEENEFYTYPCPCGDKFIISRVSNLFSILVELILLKDELLNGEDIARCPSCSLLLKVIYEIEEEEEEELIGVSM